MWVDWNSLFLVLLTCALGFVPAVLAERKGYSFLLWWLFGAALFIIALPFALLLEDKTAKACPKCAETIKRAATVCRHCGHSFGARVVSMTAADVSRDQATREAPADRRAG